MSSPLARYQREIRSVTATQLFHQIAYWWPKAKIRRDGHTWIAKSAADWCEETELTPDQYERAVQKLRRLGLVVTEQHWFGGKVITHLRLTDAGKALLEPKGQSAEAGPPKTAVAGSCKSAEPQIQGNTDNKYEQKKEKEESELALADSPGDSNNKDSGKEKESTKPKDVPEEIHKPKSHMALEALWRDTIAEIDETLVPPFTMKQKGQLKQFGRKCPPGKAEVVLQHALRYWLIFTETVERDVGAYKVPARPDVGFLLKHVGIAVNLALPKAPAPKAEPTAMPFTAPKPATAPKPLEPEGYEAPPSKEEALAFFYPPPKGELMVIAFKRSGCLCALNAIDVLPCGQAQDGSRRGKLVLGRGSGAEQSLPLATGTLRVLRSIPGFEAAIAKKLTTTPTIGSITYRPSWIAGLDAAIRDGQS